MESPPQPGRAGVLVLLAVVWLTLVAVAVRFDAAFDLPRGGRAFTLAALLAPLAGLWRYRPGGSRWPSRAVGGSALVACGLLALSLAFVPASGARVRRLLAPWSRGPTPAAAYRVVTPTGDVTVARGDGVTVAAYLDRAADGDLPRDAELTLTFPDAPPTSVPLTADDAAAFTHTLDRVETGFRYRFRVGAVEGEWHAVRVAEPTEVLPATTLTLHPPAYAKPTVPPQRLAGPPTAARTLQHSRATLDLRLNRRAETVTATWQPDGGAATDLPVTFAAAGPDARVEWAVAASGRLTLRLDADGPPLSAVRVTADADAPPVCEWLPGWPAGRREVRPDDRLPIDARFRDDVGIESLTLEYTRNADPTLHTLPLKLPGLGTRFVEGDTSVPLPPGTVAGDVVRARVVATDNRRDAGGQLTPQRTTVPPVGWTEFAVTATARPVWEQDIAARGDEMLAKLARADRHLADAAGEIDAVRAAPGPSLTPDQRVRLARAADGCRALEALASALAGELRAGRDSDALRPAVAAAAVTAGATAATLAELLGRTELPAATLREALGRTGDTLAAARDALKPLPAAVADGTQRRQAAYQLRALAAEVRALDATRPPAELRARLDAAASQLGGLGSTSEPLRRAAAAHADAGLRAFAAEVRALAGDWRRLDAAADEVADALRQEGLRSVVGKLDLLAASAEAERVAAADAARAFGLPGLPERAFAAARADLAAGRGLDALTALETAAGEFGRVAARFDATRLARREPRDAARQLAQVQADDARQFADGPPTAASLTQLAATQRTLSELAAALDAPAAVRDAVTSVAEALGRPGSDARPAYDRAQLAMSAWADATPALAARLAATRAAADALRRDLEALARGPADGATASGAGALRERVAGLDAAGESAIAARSKRLGRALAVVEADARAGRAGDLAAAWGAARREADALADESRGRTPPDELAARLALRQRLLNESAGGAAAAAEQREVTRLLSELPSSGVSGLVATALDRSRELEDAWRRPGLPPAAQLRDALAAAETLAARLHGDETDAARLERLRRAWAEPGGFQKPSPAEANADAARRAQRLIEELEAARVGPAQPAKSKATEALRQLRAVAEPERREALRQAAGEALAQLAAAAHAGPDAGRTFAAAGPEPRGEAEARVELAAGGRWPETRQVQAMRALAGAVRAAGREASEAMTRAARWPKPSPRDDYARLADALEAASPGHPAVALLRDGAGGRALATPGLPAALAAELRALSADPAAGLTRQSARLAELHARLTALAGRWPAVEARQPEAARPDPQSPGRRLGALLASAQAAGRVALDHAAAGRADATAAARRDALTALRQACFLAARLAGPPDAPDPADAAVGRAVAAAEQALGASKASPSAGGLGELAAALGRAATALQPGPVGPPRGPAE